MTINGPSPLARRRVIALMLALPAILTALGASAVEVSRVLRPTSSLFTSPSYYSLADAIRAGDLLRAHEFIRAGQDPNGLMEVSDADLTNGRSILVSPLLWAVATGRTNIVLMLVGFGAHMDRNADKMAVCLADVLGNGEISSFLRTYAPVPAPERCPAGIPPKAPLLSLTERADEAK